MFKIKKIVGIFEDYGVVKVMKFVKYRIILILIYIDLQMFVDVWKFLLIKY